MALQPHTPAPILLQVSDYTEHGITVQQTAEVLSFLYAQRTAYGGCGVTMDVLLRPCALVDGELVPLAGGLFRARTVTLTADNRTLVDAATGQQLAMRLPDMSDAQWQALIDSFPQPTQLQGNLFEQLRSEPVRTTNLLILHLQQADAMGRFS